MVEKNLKENYDFVNKNKDQLLEHYRNKYILVFNEQVVDSFDTYPSAAQEGIRRFGSEADFLVHYLVDEEPANIVMSALL
jgi:hypothetical protein